MSKSFETNSDWHNHKTTSGHLKRQEWKKIGFLNEVKVKDIKEKNNINVHMNETDDKEVFIREEDIEVCIKEEVKDFGEDIC